MNVPSPNREPRQQGWVHAHSATLVDHFRVVDLAWIVGGLWLAVRQRDATWSDTESLMCVSAVVMFTVFARVWPLYRSWRVSPLRSELGRASLCWIASVAAVGLGGYVAAPDPSDVARSIPAWTGITLAGLLVTRGGLRIALRIVRRQGGNFRVAAIAGANATGSRLAGVIDRTTWMGLRFAGFFDDRTEGPDRRADGVAVRGSFDELIACARSGEIDIVYVTLPLRSELRIRNLIDRLRDSTVTVYYVPDFSALGLLRPNMDTMSGFPIVSLIDTPHQGIDAASKRVFDLIVGSMIMMVIALPMIAIAIAIKVTSPGPVFFKQKRYGLGGREFEIWKFRSMTVCEDGSAIFTQARKGDARITPLGAFLRRTSLDELPQFINVLQGSMSIVGPRPHPVALNEAQRKLIDGYMLRHKVKPGITGWAQINGYRGETDTPEKMEGRVRYDLDYINNWSLLLDFRILLSTLTKAFNDPNAY
jgi:putative colanic acid biosynthesis UDP-glucose lipid carrier transferase